MLEERARYTPAIYTRQSEETIDQMSGFQLDHVRILSSPHFRLLQHKTQLIPYPYNHLLRNRLLHSLEVSNIADGIARKVNERSTCADLSPLELDLIHAASYAHDIGHPPFGHAGERILDGLMRSASGFESNAQTIRLLTQKVLIVSKHTLATVLKHKSAIPLVRSREDGFMKGYYLESADIVQELFHLYGNHLPENRIVDIADDVANAIYDLRDLVHFFGKNEFLRRYKHAVTPSKVMECLQFSTHERLDSTLEIVCILHDLENNVLPGLLSMNTGLETIALENIRVSYLDAIKVKILQHTMQIGLPRYQRLQIAVTKAIVKLCFLDDPINFKMEEDIRDAIERMFHGLYEGHVNVSGLGKAYLPMLEEAVDDIAKARAVCDILCCFTDVEVWHYTRKQQDPMVFCSYNY
ncbi:dGTP triphosphohydrolase [Paenibacillus planticolens]|uniref:DNTP triphosphohydrolase n=1 Tax=Paenibacillus planticolens TaxID=2654976 RepID=A0ABX1ZKN4_9BACL|nr:dNTP triphosphohydrolase [Paenibacillus planticolens]NOV00659.1 dNTP triphosphohydrolase [Paenibacillus planticolens]